MSKLPVVAAIANYNMAGELKQLLPQVLQQGYDGVYVLDDASTDNSSEVAESYGDKVTFVAGKTNKGAGGNRNRIIAALDRPAIIHFLDADVRLEGEHIASLVREVVPNTPFGFVVGLAKSPNGMQNAWNYGPRIGLKSDIGSLIRAYLIEPQLAAHPARAEKLARMFGRMLAGWPNPLARPQRREVYWGIEQNIVIRSDIFEQLGGFDEDLRETEILSLAIRMHRRGLPCYFDPRLSIVHTEGDVRPYRRDIVKLKELYRIARKYGIRNWLVSADKFGSPPESYQTSGRAGRS